MRKKLLAVLTAVLMMGNAASPVQISAAEEFVMPESTGFSMNNFYQIGQTLNGGYLQGTMELSESNPIPCYLQQIAGAGITNGNEEAHTMLKGAQLQLYTFMNEADAVNGLEHIVSTNLFNDNETVPAAYKSADDTMYYAEIEFDNGICISYYIQRSGNSVLVSAINPELSENYSNALQFLNAVNMFGEYVCDSTLLTERIDISGSGEDGEESDYAHFLDEIASYGWYENEYQDSDGISHVRACRTIKGSVTVDGEDYNAWIQLIVPSASVIGIMVSIDGEEFLTPEAPVDAAVNARLSSYLNASCSSALDEKGVILVTGNPAGSMTQDLRMLAGDLELTLALNLGEVLGNASYSDVVFSAVIPYGDGTFRTIYDSLD